MLAFERKLWKSGYEWVAGVDEAGRGPLAGPVVAACVVLPRRVGTKLEGLTDSKRLSELQRLVAEGVLSEAEAAQLLADWPQRRRSAALRADLADPQEHSYSVEVLIFAGQFATSRHRFAPIAKVVGPYTGGANITVEADHFGHGSTSDGLRFLAPSDASASGDLFVCVLEYDRSTWTLHSGDTQRVASATGTSITLQGAFSTTFHAWTDKWLVPANYGSQNADEWPREMLQPIVLADGTYAGGSSSAQPLVSP